MSKFSCTFRGYQGFLYMAPAECYFSSVVYRVDLPWAGITSIRLVSKYINGTPTSVLEVRLQGVKSSSSTHRRGHGSAKKYFFYGFQDLLVAEKQMKTIWGAHRNATPSPVKNGTLREEPGLSSNNSSHDLGSQEHEIVSTEPHPSHPENGASTVTEARRAHTTRERARSSAAPGVAPRPHWPLRWEALRRGTRTSVRGVVRVARGGSPLQRLAVVLAVGLLLVMLAGGVVGPAAHHLSRDPLKETRRLLGQLREVATEPETPGTGALWMRRLRRSTVELVDHYVHLQMELAALRRGRARRLLQSAVRPGGGGATAEEPWYLLAPAGHPREDLCDPPAPSSRPRRWPWMLRRVGEDLARWGRRLGGLAALWGGPSASTRRFLAASSTSPGGAATVRYAEPLADTYEVAQCVSPEDHQERRACLELSRELLRGARRVEDLHARFVSALLLPAYEDLAAGLEQAHFWETTTPAARLDRTRALPLSPHARFTSEQLLEALFLRRYAAAVLYLNPLETSEGRRRASAVAHVAQRTAEEAEEEAEAAAAAAGGRGNRSRTEALLHRFHQRVARQSLVSPAWGAVEARVFRNLLEELDFWSTHEDLWTAHLLAALSPSQRERLAGRTTTTATSAEKAEEDEGEWHWQSLPHFRGLLCFSTPPHRVTAAAQGGGEEEDSVAAAAVTTRPTPREEEEETEDGGAGREAEETAVSEAASSVPPTTGERRTTMDRLAQMVETHWRTELRIFTLALGEGAGSRRKGGRPHDRGSEATTPLGSDLDAIRSRLHTLVRRASQMSKGPPEEDLLEGVSPDLTSQSVLTQVTRTPWGNHKDIPFLAFSYFLSQPRNAMELKKRIKEYLWGSLGILFAALLVVGGRFLLWERPTPA